MKILNSTPADIDTIFELYDQATAYQKLHTTRYWLGFDRALVEEEVLAQRQW